MKSSYKIILLAGLTAVIWGQAANAQFLKKLKNEVNDAAQQGVEQAATNHAVNDAGSVTDKGITKTENAVGSVFKKGNGDGSSNSNGNSAVNSTSNNNGNIQDNSAGHASVADNTAVPTVGTYQNYDFVPGDTILFSDDFVGDQNGEFPSHWNLDEGQAVVNNIGGKPAFCLTEGNYCKVYPLMKTSAYLTDPFTIEFDYLPTGGAYGPILFLKYKNAGGDQEEANVQFTIHGGVQTGYFPHDFSNSYPNEDDAAFLNHWHHCAMIYKNNQLKCYVDQNRILVIPNAGIVPYGFGFGGIGDAKQPIIVTNIRAAAGGNMNMIGKKFTATKIVTHGITFDVDKADIKPESMGTLNMIVGVLKSNPDLKFEIDGHTDNTGDAAHNLTLSQQRSDAVKSQLVSMGIDGSRLTTKGFGDTKPISENATPEGRANNRRVEFVKQ